MNLDKVEVISSQWFKLKRVQGRNFMVCKLKDGFGFVPEIIIVERDTSRSNVVRLNAVLTYAESLKRKAKAKKQADEVKKVKARVDKLLGKEGGVKDGSTNKSASKKKGN